MATKRNGGRPRFGYSGCGTDLVVFTLIGVAAIWGVHYWNLREAHPFHLGKVPMPGFVSHWPRPIRNWLRPEPPLNDAEPILPEPTQTAPYPSPASASPAAPTPLPAVATPADQPSGDATPPPLPSAFATPSPDSGKSQVAATVTKLAPKVTDSPNALQASATVLAARNGTLYLGLPDGGIAMSSSGIAGKPHGTVVRLPSATGPVRAITAGGDGTVWWLAGTDGHLYSYRPSDKLLRSLDLTMLGTAVAASDDVAILPGPGDFGSVVLMGKGSTTVVDGETGALRDLSVVFPHDVATALDLPVSSAFLSMDAVTKVMRLLILGGAPGEQTSLSVWTSKSGDHPDSWSSEPIFSQSAPAFSALRFNESGRSCVGFGPGGIALLAKPAGGQTLASCDLWTTPLDVSSPPAQPYKTLPDGVFGLWAAPDRIAMGRSGVWWTFGGTIFRATLPGDKPEAYLPWNGAGDEKHGKIANILADDKGLWVATDTGVHRIVPGHPAADVGYGGYLRAPLGHDVVAAPANPTDQKLAQLTQEWQGVKYKWGGDSKQGIDCSGYVCKLFGGVGITVPRATGELANGTEGKRVRGDLQYGDVLIFPGHCGMYIGNGWTTEALDAGVGKAAIWSRKNVVVKRFLK